MKILYDKAGAAEVLSTSERRITELRLSGKLVGVLDGREWKYRADDLQRYADSLPTSLES
ncbi:DNA-binding protein [Mycolicibacterium mageritense]|uniref:Uncharacterized protein n=1 Tax=Mycolicibacterium mageritense TaxID=53462 RepID=A0AAI8XQW7_MYCME|nr:DNA-binding protein [Mycolicibacterium mageritense]BDY31450.1 hypothetical protein hbim_05402 [Mycolicibacterium mageritense]